MAKSKNLWFNLGAVALAIVIVVGIVALKQGSEEADRAVLFKGPIEEQGYTFAPEATPTSPSYSPVSPTPEDTPLEVADLPQFSTRYLKIVEEQEKEKEQQRKIAEQQQLEREEAERAVALEGYVRVVEEQVGQMESFYLRQVDPLLTAARHGDVSSQLQIIKNEVEEFQGVRPRLGEKDRLKAKEIDEITWEMYHRIMEMAISGEFSGPNSETLLRKTIQEELDRIENAIDNIKNIK